MAPVGKGSESTKKDTTNISIDLSLEDSEPAPKRVKKEKKDCKEAEEEKEVGACSSKSMGPSEKSCDNKAKETQATDDAHKKKSEISCKDMVAETDAGVAKQLLLDELQTKSKKHVAAKLKEVKEVESDADSEEESENFSLMPAVLTGAQAGQDGEEGMVQEACLGVIDFNLGGVSRELTRGMAVTGYGVVIFDRMNVLSSAQELEGKPRSELLIYSVGPAKQLRSAINRAITPKAQVTIDYSSTFLRSLLPETTVAKLGLTAPSSRKPIISVGCLENAEQVKKVVALVKKILTEPKFGVRRDLAPKEASHVTCKEIFNENQQKFKTVLESIPKTKYEVACRYTWTLTMQAKSASGQAKWDEKFWTVWDKSLKPSTVVKPVLTLDL